MKALSVMIGDIFTTGADAIVIPVNCRGVMGAGLARDIRLRWPDTVAPYQKACRDGQLRPGQVFTHQRREPPRYVIHFPTKDHWRQPSDMTLIHTGLQSLVHEVRARGIRSIAIPALGCGLGQLEWGAVYPAIVAAMEPLMDVTTLIYWPHSVTP